MRKTQRLLEVAAALMERSGERHYGYDLSKVSGVSSGVLYPMLSRFLDSGWVTASWEDPETLEERRPPRRYYELTDEGKRALGALLSAAPAARSRQAAGRAEPGFAFRGIWARWAW
jgi:PadR family transcriptional regulator PadR